MEAQILKGKNDSKNVSKNNASILDALKNITWTEEQVKEWKKNRKPLSTKK